MGSNRIPVRIVVVLNSKCTNSSSSLGVGWLIKFFNKIIGEEIIPEAWKKACILPIINSKKDVKVYEMRTEIINDCVY